MKKINFVEKNDIFKKHQERSQFISFHLTAIR